MANGIDRLQLSVKIVPMSAVLGIFCNFVVVVAASNARWVLAVMAAAAAADRQQLLDAGEGDAVAWQSLYGIFGYIIF